MPQQSVGKVITLLLETLVSLIFITATFSIISVTNSVKNFSTCKRGEEIAKLKQFKGV